MLSFTKIVHVLALGLWFGTTVSFTFFVAPLLFRTFETLSQKSREERPMWLPLPAEFDRDEATRKEQGTRIAGAAVGPIFRWYFPLQVACGLLAWTTTVCWAYLSDSRQRLRLLIVTAALAAVCGGWKLDAILSELRVARNESADAALRDPSPDKVQLAEAARAMFARWHLYSLMLNFVTIGLVTVALAMAARLSNPGVLGQVSTPDI